MKSLVRGLVLMGLATGCAPAPPVPPTTGATSNADEVRAADVSILFVGNSHTTSHDLPGLVARMIRFRHPERSVVTHVVSTAFLDDAAADPRCLAELDTRPWKFVVLQAQRISVSGKFDYSRSEGIELARRAKAGGASVFFYAEWGLRGVPGDGLKQERVYREMARDAGVNVVAPGRAWELALAERPDLPLYESDGNHQSEVGAFLTAAVLYTKLTGESPASLSAFPHSSLSAADREFLANIATRVADE